MHKVKYGLFYDFHTHLENPDAGKDFDAERFTDELLRCGVDYLTFHARCNGGFAYYDTAIGIKHPSLKRDLFGELSSCCEKKNIALVAYLNGGISTQEAMEQIQWRTLYIPGKNRFGSNGPFAITMCYNSPYREHLKAMIREIATKYPVKGFFLDCLAAFPCVCPHCVKLMKERSLDCRKEEDVALFAEESVLSICRDIKETVHSLLEDPMLFFNINHGNGRDLDTFFDVECVTSAGRGHEYLPLLSHIVRNVKEDRQVLNMVLRFHNWADFGSLRSRCAMEYDLLYGLAQGMRPNLGGHMHPRCGSEEMAPLRRVRDVYQKLQKFDSFFEEAVNLTDTGIVYPSDDKNLRVFNSMFSSVRVLDELKVQFDILLADCEKSWEKYKLLILPEQVKVTPLLRQRILDHVARGGAFFACGKNAAEGLGDLLGIRSKGKLEMDPVYFKMRSEYSSGMEEMYLSSYAPACEAEPAPGTETPAYIVKPYYSRHWSGTHAVYYTPPQEETSYPFLTRKGKCVWCSADLFNGYADRGALHLRQLVKNIVFELLEKPLLVYDRLPGVLRMIVTEQSSRRNIHLLAYHGEKRGKEVCMEEPLTFCDLEFALYTGTKKVLSVCAGADRKPLEYTLNGDYTRIKVNQICGYEVVSVSLEE